MKRILCLSLLALSGLSSAAHATWSVVIVNRATREVALGQATCIVGSDLQRELAVVVPGVGGACVQAWWDFNGLRRSLIWHELQAGTHPTDIVDLLNALPNPQIYQFGIASVDGPATFTGSAAMAWAGGLTGQVGDLSYAIQGNVLAGQAVVLAAEQALLAEHGDLTDRLVAAMLAAAQTGGDGRCSCNNSAPASCGAPVPGFDLREKKSAHCGFLLVSRVGDPLGICDTTDGCATSGYYMNVETLGQAGLPDPIVELRQEVHAWRATLDGRPDHLRSRRLIAPSVVPGDGQSTATIRIGLVDHRGVALSHGGATLDVQHAATSAGLATIGGVVDHQDGTYSVALTAGLAPGTDAFVVRVDDGQGVVLLYPFPTLSQL